MEKAFLDKAGLQHYNTGLNQKLTEYRKNKDEVFEYDFAFTFMITVKGSGYEVGDVVKCNVFGSGTMGMSVFAEVMEVNETGQVTKVQASSETEAHTTNGQNCVVNATRDVNTFKIKAEDLNNEKAVYHVTNDDGAEVSFKWHDDVYVKYAIGKYEPMFSEYSEMKLYRFEYDEDLGIITQSEEENKAEYRATSDDVYDFIYQYVLTITSGGTGYAVGDVIKCVVVNSRETMYIEVASVDEQGTIQSVASTSETSEHTSGGSGAVITATASDTLKIKDEDKNNENAIYHVISQDGAEVQFKHNDETTIKYNLGKTSSTDEYTSNRFEYNASMGTIKITSSTLNIGAGTEARLYLYDTYADETEMKNMMKEVANRYAEDLPTMVIFHNNPAIYIGLAMGDESKLIATFYFLNMNLDSEVPTGDLSDNADKTISKYGAKYQTWNLQRVVYDEAKDKITYDGSYRTLRMYENGSGHFLSTDNKEEFTPTGDYQPATKKYVDDLVTTGGEKSVYVYSEFTPEAELKAMLKEVAYRYAEDKTCVLQYHNNPAIYVGLFPTNEDKMVATFYFLDTRFESIVNDLGEGEYEVDNSTLTIPDYGLNYEQWNLTRLEYNEYEDKVTISKEFKKLRLYEDTEGVGFLATNNEKEYTPTNDYNPSTKKYVDDVSRETLLKAYPVGAIYLSMVDTDPATLFGGTWQQIAKGRVLVGVDDEVNTTANTEVGAKTHTHTNPTSDETILTIEQIPSHTHPFKIADTYSYDGDEYEGASFRSAVDTYGVLNFSSTTEATGGGTGHTHTIGATGEADNLPLALTCYMWQRTE